METTTDDATLVGAAHLGDKEAFAQLLGRHWSLLLSLCRRMLANEDLAQDAAQDAALQAFLSLGLLRRAESFAPGVDWPGVLAALRAIRYAGPLTVEFESYALLAGPLHGDPVAAARMCFNLTQELVKGT
jgi:RNA polymerase sigma-70 factor (ECF subfamily)